jgi:uncharacterized protein (DUF952 family)
VSEVVFHIARREDWEAAAGDGEYRVSTLGRTLADVGFIHCSASRAQVLAVAAAVYADVAEPLLLLSVDVDRVGSMVRYEASADGPEPFPHVYGPLPVSSVSTVVDFERDSDGTFVWPYAEA